MSGFGWKYPLVEKNPSVFRTIRVCPRSRLPCRPRRRSNIALAWRVRKPVSCFGGKTTLLVEWNLSAFLFLGVWWVGSGLGRILRSWIHPWGALDVFVGEGWWMLMVYYPLNSSMEKRWNKYTYHLSICSRAVSRLYTKPTNQSMLSPVEIAQSKCFSPQEKALAMFHLLAPSPPEQLRLYFDRGISNGHWTHCPPCRCGCGFVGSQWDKCHPVQISRRSTKSTAGILQDARRRSGFRRFQGCRWASKSQ